MRIHGTSEESYSPESPEVVEHAADCKCHACRHKVDYASIGTARANAKADVKPAGQQVAAEVSSSSANAASAEPDGKRSSETNNSIKPDSGCVAAGSVVQKRDRSRSR